MFTLGFELDSNGQLAHIGLNSSDTTGYETPATLKDALKDLSVQNPCIVFSHLCDDENFKSSLTQWEIGTIAEACDLLKELWQYDMIKDPDKNDIRARMNPLQLLENALNIIYKQQQFIDAYTGKKWNVSLYDKKYQK